MQKGTRVPWVQEWMQIHRVERGCEGGIENLGTFFGVLLSFICEEHDNDKLSSKKP